MKAPYWLEAVIDTYDAKRPDAPWLYNVVDPLDGGRVVARSVTLTEAKRLQGERETEHAA